VCRFTAKHGIDPARVVLRHKLTGRRVYVNVVCDLISLVTALKSGARWGILPGRKFQTIPISYQCGLNVFPVSSSVFRRERIRGHPSAQAE
jgi:hypothetical protein